MRAVALRVAVAVTAGSLAVAAAELVSSFLLGPDAAPTRPPSGDLESVSRAFVGVDANRVPLVPDAHVLWRNRPLATRTLLVNPRRAGRADTWSLRINSGGYRSAERTFKGDAFRVLCIGDSITFGFNVDQDSPFPARLERLLRRRHPGATIEVINTGVAGWTWPQGRRFLEQEGLGLRPDLVIAAYGTNDRFWPARITDIERLRHLESPLARGLFRTANLLARTNTSRAVQRWWDRSEPPYSPGCQQQIEETGMCRRASGTEIEATVHDVLRLTRAAGSELLVLNLDFLLDFFATGAARSVRAAVERDGTPFLDLIPTFDAWRAREQERLARRLGLSPPRNGAREDAGGEVPAAMPARRVLFRVLAGRAAETVAVRGGLFAWQLFDESMYDDGTHGDEVARDGVFSVVASIPGDWTRLCYQFLRDGQPEFQTLPPNSSSVGERCMDLGRVSAPMDTFGELFTMAESVHPDARGHRIIARAVAAALDRFALAKKLDRAGRE